MKIIPYSLITVFLALLRCAPSNSQQTDTRPISHQAFTELLKKNVNEDGMVNYRGFEEEREKFNKYLDLVKKNPPNDENWPEEDQIAYWINAYNAFTIDLILQHYPVKSIKDIGSSIQIPFVNTPWDIKFIEIGGEKYDLNNLEHGILREKWNEPTIHFAVNCASFSCPRLRNEAYEGEKLNEQLDEQGRLFVNNNALNSITKEKAQLSKIFDWYSGDFKKVKPIRDFINQYSDVKITNATEIEYKEYTWTLNEQN